MRRNPGGFHVLFALVVSGAVAGQGPDTKNSTELFGKDRFGSEGAPTEPAKRPYSAPPESAPKAALSTECRAVEVSAEAVKKSWRPPPGFCEAAHVPSHCVWENIERAWLVVKHDPKKFCSHKKHVGLMLIGGLERLGVTAKEVFAFFPKWMFEDRSPFDPVLLLLPCETGTRQKPEPPLPVLRMMKFVNC